MRLTKKGDLALSTNAIVVLIIAVIILGLIIAFITTTFDNATGQLGGFSEIATPETPSSSEPVTQRGSLTLNAGEQFTWKVMIYNPTDTEKIAAYPTIECLTKTPAVIDLAYDTKGLKGFTQDIGIRDVSTVYEVTGKIARNAPEGAQTCRLSGAVTAGDAETAFATRDITLTIKN